MTVTPASLIARYPEWTGVNARFPTVVTEAISIGEDSVDEAVLGDRYDEAVMLSACSWLYAHPYSRDTHKPSNDTENPYRAQLDTLLRQKGSAWRTVWASGDFGGYT